MLPFWHFFSKHIHTYNLIFSSKDTLSDKKGSLFLVANKKTEGEWLADLCPTSPSPGEPPATEENNRPLLFPVHEIYQLYFLYSFCKKTHTHTHKIEKKDAIKGF